MANFLITSPNSLTQGSNENDVMVFTTALGNTIQGLDGNDLISASNDGNNGTVAIFGGNAGADTISVGSGATLNVGGIYGGADNDLINIGAGYSATDSTINGGGGADSIIVSAGMTFTRGRFNLNGGNDFLTASGVTFNTALIALGGGNDSIEFVSGVFNVGTIAAGGGNDVISANGVSGVGVRIEGDTVGDTEFYGNDLLAFSASNFTQSALIQGGGGSDTLEIGSISTGVTINGNAGRDTISISAFGATGAGALVGGGAGADFISANATLSGVVATINGGGQNDVISFSGVAGQANSGASAAYLQGGAGADTIGLGTVTGAGTLLYTAASDSNVAAYDYVSAGMAASGAGGIIAAVGGIASTAQAVTGINLSTFTGTNGVITFTGTFNGSVTARATELDRILTVGQVGAFADGAGNEFLFMQGGAAASGVDGDLLFQYSAAVGAVTGITINNNTAISLNF